MKTIWTKEQKEILRKAASILQKRGWIKNSLFRGRDGRVGPVCLVGAIHAVVNNGNADWPAERGVIEEIRLNFQNRLRTDPAIWNNKPDRKKSEVVGLLKRIAAA